VLPLMNSTVASRLDLTLRGRGASFVVPRDAQRGQTIHFILEVTDGATPAHTRYQCVIATVK
jgi:hypothetical protein